MNENSQIRFRTGHLVRALSTSVCWIAMLVSQIPLASYWLFPAQPPDLEHSHAACGDTLPHSAAVDTVSFQFHLWRVGEPVCSSTQFPAGWKRSPKPYTSHRPPFQRRHPFPTFSLHSSLQARSLLAERWHPEALHPLLYRVLDCRGLGLSQALP